MTDDRPSDLLGQLPRTRPHRRSAKRPARASEASGAPAKAEGRGPDPKPGGAAKARGAGKARRAAKARTAGGATAKAKAGGATAKAKAGAATAKPGGSTAKAKPRAATAKAKPRVATAGSERLAQPAQPRGVPARPRTRRPAPSSARSTPASPAPILGTAVQAAAELAEIGLALSGRALRRAIGRLPRP